MKETWGYHRCNQMPENRIDPSKPSTIDTPNDNVKPKKAWRKVRVKSGAQCPHCGTISRFVEP